MQYKTVLVSLSALSDIIYRHLDDVRERVTALLPVVSGNQGYRRSHDSSTFRHRPEAKANDENSWLSYNERYYREAEIGTRAKEREHILFKTAYVFFPKEPCATSKRVLRRLVKKQNADWASATSVTDLEAGVLNCSQLEQILVSACRSK